MQTSENGIAFIKQNEGFVPHVYDDNGHPAIGYGHDIQGDVPEAWARNGITEPSADSLLRADLSARFEPRLNALIPPGILPTQNQYDALVDFDYNLGGTALATMMHHGWTQIPTQVPAWCYKHVHGASVKDDGLEARRAKEVALFNTPV